MVAVQVNSAVAAKGQDDLRAILADLFDQHACQLVEVLLVEFAVGIVKNFSVREVEKPGSGVEFITAQLGKLFVAGGDCHGSFPPRLR